MKIFALFDEDNSGGISFRNLKRVATELGENLTDEELQALAYRNSTAATTIQPPLVLDDCSSMRPHNV
eukprot:7813-Heterococcus_DN1.PRE.2